MIYRSALCFLYMPLYDFLMDGMVFFIICWIRICYYLIIRWLIPNLHYVHVYHDADNVCDVTVKVISLSDVRDCLLLCIVKWERGRALPGHEQPLRPSLAQPLSSWQPHCSLWSLLTAWTSLSSDLTSVNFMALQHPHTGSGQQCCKCTLATLSSSAK